jgi:hypothetical protein
MFDKRSALHIYALGYFARKHDLERESARLLLGIARGPREANRLARLTKLNSKQPSFSRHVAERAAL